MCDLALHRCQGKLMNFSSMNIHRYKWWGWTPVVWWLPISVVGLTVYAGIYNAYYTKFTWSLHEPISFQHISLQLDNIVNKHAILSIPFIHGHTAGLRRWPCINCVNLYQCVSYQTWSTTHSCTADTTLPDTPSSPRYSAIEWFLARNSWATLLTAYSAAPPRHKRSPFSWFFPKKVRKNSKICAMVLL